MTTVALVATVAAFRAVTALLFAIGTGALVTAALSFLYRSGAGAAAGSAWVGNLTTLAAQVAAIGLVSAVFSARRAPSIVEIRRGSLAAEPNNPAHTLFLAGLAVAAALQVPALMAWYREDRALLMEMLGTERDPLRLDLVPAVILYSLPTLAAVLFAVCAMTSFSASLAPRRLAVRFLTAGVVLQAGLVAIAYLVGRGVQDLGSGALRLMADTPPADTAGAVAWILRHEAVATSMTPRLIALFAGYVIALGIAWYVTPSPGPIVVGMTTPAASAPQPAAPAVIAAVPPPILATPSPFTEPFYVVRLRSGLAGLMLGRIFVSYIIQTVPPKSRSEYSFSWSTGVVMQEPSGPELLRVQASERRDLLKRAHVVSDPGTGAVIGKLLPHSSDWQIVDVDGRPVADVVQSSASFHQTSYSISAGGQEVCRLVAVMGATAASSEVQIEFRAGSTPPFERSLAIALAPILEERARRSRWV